MEKAEREKSKPQVRFYTRPGCHLCEEARAEILAAACPEAYDFHEINIEEDPTALELYRYEIPVITINGIKAFKYRLTAAEFRSRLQRFTRA